MVQSLHIESNVSKSLMCESSNTEKEDSQVKRLLIA